ncbi:MAG TPA: 3-deoxy-manno-octulosonate cytidylyltransferase [Alphaproteobacteria bacterium]|nr:3-deoxy-manno-octulosonate cytidylyltransferase [Alphaproteobacteria bacterium]
MGAPGATRSLILIPARMASTRLPGKPLADIHGEPMIVQVWRRAVEADLADVVVAAAEPEIKAAIEAKGGRAVLTDPNHPSGTDRIFEALQACDPDRTFDRILNIQGDLPTLDPRLIRELDAMLSDERFALATLVARITREEERTNPNVVKAVVAWESASQGRALYFTRATAPWGPGEHWHHIGLYGWQRAALERFVALKPSSLEMREKLEQLRALEAGMTIGVAAVETVPLGVDTPEDLTRARELLAHRPKG